jgi:tetratricopeptide (TPR) repeat protein
VARRRELIFPSERPSLDVSTEYVFKHALLRDVTYGTVLLGDRQALHTLVADWLEANAGERLGEMLELIAEHRVLGRDHLAAADLFHRAAVRALEAGRSVSGRRLIERAIAIWSEWSDDPPADALVVLAEACCRLGCSAEAHDFVTTALTKPLTPERLVDALYVASWAASELGDRDQEEELLTRALPLAETVGGDALFHVRLGLAWFHSGAGDLDAAERAARQALEVAESSDRHAQAWLAIGVVLSLRGDLDGADRCSRRALEIARSNGDLEREALALGGLGVTAHLRGDASGEHRYYEQAVEHYGAQLALLRRAGLDRNQAMPALNLAQVSLRLGHLDDARARIADAIPMVVEQQSPALAAFAVIVHADLLLVNGRIEEALVMLGAVRGDQAARESDHQEIERVLDRVQLSVEELDRRVSQAERRDLAAVLEDVAASYRD